MTVPAIVTVGDRRAAKAVHGESKVYLEIDGRSLVARVVGVLQLVPEVSEVWLVGDAERLRKVFAQEALRKPLRFVEQFSNLYENCWQTYRRLLPGASPEGRDPEGADLDCRVLYLSGDLPFATPQEISAFIQSATALDADYTLGLVTDEALESFLPRAVGEPGLEVAYFNLHEARLRQNNLHLVRPGRLGNRHYIEEMYEHRHQLEWRNILSLAWRLLRSKSGGMAILLYYLLMQLAGFADRHGWDRLALAIRRRVSLARVEVAISSLLDTRFRFSVGELGGCAVDIDTEQEYDAARQRFAEWSKDEAERAEALYGPPGGSDPEERG
ncbi:MAG: hypothetical protein V3T33_06015 [Myxococcota bacterium]